MPDRGRPFLWFEGRTLGEALAFARLTLDDGPLFPIRIVGVHPGEAGRRHDPVFDRERHLLDRSGTA